MPDQRPPDHLRDQDGDTARRLGRWVVGTAGAMVQYPFRRIPVYRRDRTGHDCVPPDLHRDLPGDPATLQRVDDGVGPLFHRRFWIVLADCATDAKGLLGTVASDVNRVAPGALSRFEAADGSAVRDLQVGDEAVVRLPGPWDGPVRVVARDDHSLRLVTLVGHIEAGEIEFSTADEDHGFVRFTVESWARSGNDLFRRLYTTVPLAQEIQLLMWAQVCQGAARVADGVVMSNVEAITHVVPEDQWR